jgi:CRP-like cAMP-binding protein
VENGQNSRVTAIIQKVSVFKGFNLTEAQRLLKLCKPVRYRKSEVLFQSGDASRQMYVLLQGKLNVVNETGTMLGEILPGTTIGEMGVLTGSPRSATAVSVEDSGGFAIEGPALMRLLDSDDEIRTKVLWNVVRILADRLIGANRQIETYAVRGRDSQ